MGLAGPPLPGSKPRAVGRGCGRWGKLRQRNTWRQLERGNCWCDHPASQEQGEGVRVKDTCTGGGETAGGCRSHPTRAHTRVRASCSHLGERVRDEEPVETPSFPFPDNLPCAGAEGGETGSASAFVVASSTLFQVFLLCWDFGPSRSPVII